MLKHGDEVKIQMPSGMAAKFPAFAASFEGMRAIFLGDVVVKDFGPIWPIETQRNVIAGLVAVDVTRPGDDKQSVIRIDRQWLADR